MHTPNVADKRLMQTETVGMEHKHDGMPKQVQPCIGHQAGNWICIMALSGKGGTKQGKSDQALHIS